MAIKNITYQRVINLGNYESKRLELSAEVLEGDDAEESIARVMEMVERKVREDAHSSIESEIRELKKELRELKNEYETVKSSLETVQTAEEPSLDDIPFEAEAPKINDTEDF